MLVSIIVATTTNRVIGKDNDMPWGRLPADLKHFKDTTMGHPVIMGRKTFDSIRNPLPGRKNVVITSLPHIDGCEVYPNIESALDALKDEEEVFVIGGGTIYKQFLPLADKLYITYIDATMEGDTFFPDFQEKQAWEVISKKHHPKDKDNKYTCVFMEYRKNKKQ